jgi:hypothetical protein
MTRASLLKRGSCCGNKCTNCPYTPRHKKGSIMIEVIEKIHYDLNGEVTKRTYTINTPGEFDYLRTFNSYGEARQYIKDSYGI